MKVLTLKEKVSIAAELRKKLFSSNGFEKFLDLEGFEFMESFMEMTEKDNDDEKAQELRMNQCCDIVNLI